MTDYFKHLPHVLPSNHQEAANRLALMLKIPLAHVVSADEYMVEAISGVILYRHLDRMEKQDVMRSIYALKSKQLQSFLVIKVTDVIVNPTWGLWSLTSDELNKKTGFHADFDFWLGSFIGVGVNLMSVGALITKVRKIHGLALASKAGILATIIVYGAIMYNKSELARCHKEIANRTPPMNGSPYYD